MDTDVCHFRAIALSISPQGPSYEEFVRGVEIFLTLSITVSGFPVCCQFNSVLRIHTAKKLPYSMFGTPPKKKIL